jgi:hypothetical protein
MTCQICSLKDPTCLRAVSTKTPRRISTEGSGKDTIENSIDPVSIEPTNLKNINLECDIYVSIKFLRLWKYSAEKAAFKI